jgi:hypothetical protein
MMNRQHRIVAKTERVKKNFAIAEAFDFGFWILDFGLLGCPLV